MQHAANDTDRLVNEDHHAACDGCELLDRRRFLTQAAATVIGAMVGLGMSAERAVALPLSFMTGVRSPNGKDLTFPIPPPMGRRSTGTTT